MGARNFAHIQAFVDGIVTVTEAEIRAAMRAIVAATRLVPEPSGAVATAALLFHAAELPAYTTAVAVVSGGNVDPALLAEILTDSVEIATVHEEIAMTEVWVFTGAHATFPGEYFQHTSLPKHDT